VSWDRERYRLEVLEPARRAGNVPPADLYLRYGLPPHVASERIFADRVAEVLTYWQELKTKRTYARLAETMIAAHAKLGQAGQLKLAAFAAHRKHEHQAQLAQLARLAEVEAGAATHVGPVTVARLRSALGGSVTEEQVRDALARSGVRVVGQFPELPVIPHPKHAGLAQHVQLLGRRLSPEVVFGDAVQRGFRVLGGFRLADGRALDEQAITAARSRVDALPYVDPAKTPTENVLAILRAAVRTPGDLDALLLSEITERLRPLAESGFLQRAIASQARDLGLVAEEAGLLAAAMLADSTLDLVRRQVEEELAGGRLRTAQRLAAGLPAGDPLRERIAARDAEAGALTRRADAELARGQREQAAALLAEAIAMTDDAELASRLAALPPPPPAAATARLAGEQVLIVWEPSPALAGRLHYRVMRGLGRPPASAADGTEVAEATTGLEAADRGAPAGAELHYSVFAGRGEAAWSPPAVTRPVVLAPDVADVRVEASDTSVVVSWRAHPSADGVLVARTEGRPPRGGEDGAAVEASLAGFADSGLRTGTEYFYRIVVSYRANGGQTRRSAGLVVPARPAPVPQAVTDLDVRMDGATVVATWTPPRHGRVRLVRSDRPSPWPPGTSITSEDAARMREIPGLARRGSDGRDRLTLSLPGGRHHVLALTFGDRSIIAGNAAEIGLVEAVSGLSARRMHDVVHLSWIWPADATDALVRWPGGERHYSRRVYDDEGGVSLTVGPEQATLEVAAVYALPDGRLTAPAVAVTVPGRGVAVTYRIRRGSRRRPRQRKLVFDAECPALLPAVVVVRAAGAFPPDDPAEGETIARLGPRRIAPGQPVEATVDLPSGAGWLACFIAPQSAGADGRSVLLFHPPTQEMRIR
jgi:hypothetical protein